MNSTMVQVAELAQRFNGFNEDLLNFVQSCGSAN